MANPTATQLAEDVLRLGLRPGGVTLVHASLRSLCHNQQDPIAGGAETVIKGLLKAVGLEGTLLMPALSFETVTAEQSQFDIRSSRSCVGIIPETFRRTPNVLRSLHPTHSVCGMGPQAAAMLGDHHKDRTPCGKHSPLRKLRDTGGQILMLGCGLLPNTSMHAIEELAPPEYLFGPLRTYQLTDSAGKTSSVVYRPHGFAGWLQRYDRVSALLSPTNLREDRGLGAQAFLVEATALWEAVQQKLHVDPLFFVDREL